MKKIWLLLAVIFLFSSCPFDPMDYDESRVIEAQQKEIAREMRYKVNNCYDYLIVKELGTPELIETVESARLDFLEDLQDFEYTDFVDSKSLFEQKELLTKSLAVFFKICDDCADKVIIQNN